MPTYSTDNTRMELQKELTKGDVRSSRRVTWERPVTQSLVTGPPGLHLPVKVPNMDLVPSTEKSGRLGYPPVSP